MQGNAGPGRNCPDYLSLTCIFNTCGEICQHSLIFERRPGPELHSRQAAANVNMKRPVALMDIFRRRETMSIYIPLLALAFLIMPCNANAGDLEHLTNTLENLADMSRSADDAHEAMRNAFSGRPGRYYYYRDDDDDDWEERKHYRERRHHHDKGWHRGWHKPRRHGHHHHWD